MTLAPHQGGAIRDLQWRGRDVLRPTPHCAGDDPLDLACFPLVPYANRVANGRFSFRGRSVSLQRNWSKDPHPLHGQGWRASWAVAEASSSTAVLRFAGGADEWPWRYACEQQFRLLQSGLEIDLAIENQSITAMPAMLGLHPYFPDASHARLLAQTPRVWLADEGALPVREVETPSQWAFEPARLIQGVALDHCFTGWSGVASLQWPGLSVTMLAARCPALHIYAPSGHDYFCVEPQSAAAGALSREAAELAVVGPGQSFAIQIRFIFRTS